METDPTNATVEERHDLNPELAIVKVRPDSGQVPHFKPGQFITLAMPKTLPPEVAAMRKTRPGRVPMTRRAYSIASSPLETEMLEFFVVLIEEGKLTPRLWDVGVGGRLWMDNIVKGDFTLDPVPDGKDLVMFSTGTGIAPFVSMLRTFHGTNRWRRFVMVNGVRRVIDLGYRDELEQLAKQDPDFCYIPLVSRPTEEDNWSGLKGRIPILLESDRFLNCAGVDLDPEHCHVFLCGNPAMIDDMEALLIERGFKTHEAESPGNIHFERYW